MANVRGHFLSALGFLFRARARRWFLVAATGLIATFQSSPASAALVVGGWSAARAGDFALDGLIALLVRLRVQLAVPGCTFVTTNTLTDEFLSGVDAVFLTTADSFSSIIDPLSVAEQSALHKFVLNGGAAILLADGEFVGGVRAVNNSMTSPFGVSAGNLISGETTAVPTSNSHPIIHGPFGDVTTMHTFYPGWFDNLGPYATAIGELTENGKPFLAVIPPHALSPTSGPVVIACDPAPFVPPLYGNTDTLLLNTFAYVPEPPSLLLATLGGCVAAAIAAFRQRRAALRSR